MPQTKAPATSITLEKMAQMLEPVRRRFVREVHASFTPSLPTLLAENPMLIHVVSHGPSLGPWPVAAALSPMFVEAGGGQRRPFGEAHRLLFNIPIVSDVVTRMLNADGPFSFSQVLERLRSGDFTDYVVLPEGDNCTFGDQRFMRPFRSHRYLELAVRLQCPILLTCHRGTEPWAFSLRLDEFGARSLHLLAPILYHRMGEDRILHLPAIPTPIPHLYIASELYWPTLKAADLPEDPDALRRLLREESHEVRQQMNRMLADLDARAHEE